MTLTAGQSKDITITTNPSDATNTDEVIASTAATSNDNTIATVANGAVTGTFTISGIKTGTATVKFTSGDLSTTLSVTVNDATDPTK